MRSLRLSLLLALLLQALIGSAEHTLAWQTLRTPVTVPVMVVDTIVGRDTVWRQESRIVPGQFNSLLCSDSLHSVSMIPSALTFRCPTKPISFQPRDWRDLAHPDTFSISRSLPQDVVGLSALDRAKYDYMIAHPEKVDYTWDVVPEPWRDFSEGRRAKTKASDNKSISKIFQTDDYDARNEKLRKKAAEPVGPWKTSGEENLQFSQLYVNNWIKGGENSATLTHDLRMKANYSKNRSQWDNSLTNKLSITYTSALGTRVSSDAFDAVSKYGFKAVNKWYYSFAFSLKTQLFRNYDKSDVDKVKPKSKLMSPVYLQFIFGMDYKTDNLSLLLSPYTGVITAVADTDMVDQTKYGISQDRKADFNNGFSVTLNWKKEITYGVNYSTKLELFYEYFKKDGDKRFNWENVMDVQINRYLSTRFLVELRYYDNESKRFQIKENFSVGFKYAF
ncbi:MAG: DUF3078 domain-containing protein [Bacteroidales bacterium]|nr:DUF3078 domain-containing protein [Bacteroidales bacterium]